MKKTQIKKRSAFTMAMALVLCMATLITSLAIFRDYEELTISDDMQMGSMDVVFTDLSSVTNRVGEIDAISHCWEYERLLLANSVLIPNAGVDISYKVENTGTISADVKQRICVTSTVAFDTDDCEIKIRPYSETWYSAQTKTGDPFASSVDITPTFSADGKTAYFEFPTTILNGSKESSGTSTSDIHYICFYLDDDDNSQQSANLTLTLQVQAKQHKNTTDADYVEWADLGTISQVVNEE